MSKIKQNRLSVQNAVIEPDLFISFFIASCYILARIHPYYDHRKEGQNMSVSTTMKKFGLEQAFNYLYKDPEKNMRKLFSWAEKYAGKMYPHQLEQVKDAIENPENPYYRYIRHLIGDVDQDRLAEAMRTEGKIQLQHPLDDPAGPHLRLQSALHRLLGGGIWQQAESFLR